MLMKVVGVLIVQGIILLRHQSMILTWVTCIVLLCWKTG
uniref:Uncharacterized protein n=1 Tax=Cucumis melo TaxID=3656 RepID=A0A9I9DAN8_CUCME